MEEVQKQFDSALAKFGPGISQLAYSQAIDCAAARLRAVADDRIPGLWSAPGYPELTSGQLLWLAAALETDR